jgi:hypothetical protein
MMDNHRSSLRKTVVMVVAAVLLSGVGHGVVSAAADPRPHRTGLKIEAAGSGFYRITGREITDAGIAIAGMNPDRLRMFHLDKEIPITVSTSGPNLAADDAIAFYAPGVDNRFTGTDVFWLFWGGGTDGRRISGADSRPAESDPPVTGFHEKLTFEENRVMWSGVPGAPEADYWFWERLTAPQSGTFRFDAPSLISAGENATLTLFLQGRLDGPALHHVEAELNGEIIGDIYLSGNEAREAVLSFPPSRLTTRNNTLKLNYRGPVKGVLYLNRFELAYHRRLEAVDDRLNFSIASSRPRDIVVSGFSHNAIRVYDITDPAEPVRADNVNVAAGGGGFRATFSHPGGEKVWMAVAADRVRGPDRITARPRSDLKNTENGADYILITAGDLAPSLEQLLELRRRQGLRTALVDIEEIYDLFSYGRFDPSAIREFLAHAWRHWQPPAPRYVLLAGDANLDYRNYFGTGKKNIVPGLLESTPELGLIPSDNGYACVSGNAPLPDIYIGRIPGSTPAAMTAIVDKMIRYESNRHQPSDRVLLVADDDETAFEELNDQLASYLSPPLSPERIYARRYDRMADVTADIVSAVNTGMLLTSFVGHGDVTRWGVAPEFGNFILVPRDLSSLTNSDRLTVVLALNCLNGYFSQSFHYSLAEEWVKAANRGAVACFAPAGLAHQWEHEFLSHLIFEKIFLNGQNRLGEVTLGAKVDAYYSGVSDKVLTSFNLIGDPATRLAIHRTPGDLVRIHAITAAAGTGGTIAPAGEVMVFSGGSQTFILSPAAGYRVKSITVDGKAESPVSEYRFSGIRADHSISAAFETTGSSGGGGDNGGGGNGGGTGGGSGGGCFIGALFSIIQE